MSLPRLLLPVLLASALAACGGDDSPGRDGGSRDGSVRDSGRGDGGDTDAGGRDAGTDGGGMLCAGEVCEPFQFCDRMVCRDYPGCLSMDMCPDGSICRHRFCLPEDADPDGDGHTADVDCDETNPEINPGMDEVCNGIDDNCDEEIDEGDPAALCADDPSGGECMGGTCGCPEGSFDLDDSVPGCECVAEPARTEGVTCGAPIDLGDMADSGDTMNVSGNVLPDDRQVWYRFRGVDSADTSCDNLHVRVQLTTNPDDTFGFQVFRGDCSSGTCSATEAYTDFSWATDFRGTVEGRLAGQCPCTAPGAGRTADVSVCEDDSADYFVRVFRLAGKPVTCDGYTLEISNGVYDTP